MSGRMMVTPIVQIAADTDLQTSIASLSRALLVLVPGDPESGGVYILDRKTGTWYSVDFDDNQYGGYGVSHLEELLKDCHFLDLVERPGLWRAGLNWWVESGKRPESRV